MHLKSEDFIHNAAEARKHELSFLPSFSMSVVYIDTLKEHRAYLLKDEERLQFS
jgi:hypothetical protein